MLDAGGQGDSLVHRDDVDATMEESITEDDTADTT
jgi:hypothetical protein